MRKAGVVLPLLAITMSASIILLEQIRTIDKQRLENMKQKVAGMDKHEKVKEKEEVR